ncbi:hypothetical protein [Actinacidiphila glaucinigra]|uniref:hypothetical protein n=1 Tax=Actinacidiphila glaucinigra TaxID=235986 RepID=UPI0036E3A588
MSASTHSGGGFCRENKSKEVVRLRRHSIRLAATLLAVSGVAAALGGCGSDEADVDKASYTAGYDAFGGAELPASDESRDAVEARCGELWPAAVRASGKKGLKEQDWVQGCADAAEGKDPRYGD